MKKALALFLTLAVGAFALCLGGCAGQRPEPVKAGDTLIVGITIYEPMNFYDENDKLVGFDTEFAEKALGELGYGIEFQVINWDNKVNELNSGKIDLIWNGMTISETLRNSIAISDAYMENKQVVVTKKENVAKFTSIESVLGAKSIAVESGSAGEATAKDCGAGNKITALEAQSDCLLEVKTGASEIALIDYTMAMSMTGEGTDYADLAFADVGFEGEEYGIGLRKADTELLAALNAIIARYKTDGTFDELIAKYIL